MAERLKVAALLTAVFLVACFGAIVGTWLVHGGRVTDWGDVATWVAGSATLLTAMVAVTPIFIEAQRRRELAMVIRRQLILHLGAIAGSLAHMLDVAREKNLKDDAFVSPRTELSEDIAAVRQLFADAHLLDAKEFDLLFRAISLLEACERMHGGFRAINVEHVRAAEGAASAAYDAFMARERERRRLSAADAAPPAPPPRPPRAEPG
jgi:hypothetical protein